MQYIGRRQARQKNCHGDVVMSSGGMIIMRISAIYVHTHTHKYIDGVAGQNLILTA